MRIGSLVAVSFGLLALAACSSAAEGELAPETDGPGQVIPAKDDPSCTSNDECEAGEQCVDGLCQIQRCGSQAYSSVPPLGTRKYLSTKREIVVASNADDARTLDGYNARGNGFVHGSKLRWQLDGDGQVLDVAGGDVTGERPESMVAITEGDQQVHVISGDVRKDIPLKFAPIAVATGDLDGDSIAEIAALADNGTVAICRFTTQQCITYDLEHAIGKDLTIADVDADGFGEVVILVDDEGGTSHLVTFNENGSVNGQTAQINTPTSVTLTRLAGGPLGDDGAQRVVAIEDGTLHRFAQKDGALAEEATSPLADDAVDLYVGDIDGDEKNELLVLEESGIEVFDGTTFGSQLKTLLGDTTSATRIAMADVDGDSPIGILEGDSQLVPGPLVPIAVLVYPPYSRTYSDGTSSISLGTSESQGNAATQSVGLSGYVMLGLEGAIPGVVKGGIYAKVSADIQRSQTNGQSVSIGDIFTVSAKPDLEGPDNGVVLMGCGCFHGYSYRIDDPANVYEGANQNHLAMLVPVGGQTAVWSVKRYDALAAKVGGLPAVNVPWKVGDPTSYSQQPVSLGGEPIADEDYVFTTPKSYRVSDVAQTGWSLTMTETESKRESTSVAVSLTGRIGVGPVVVEVGGTASRGAAYEVSVGKSASFSGAVPPIRNVASTPEDENALNAYGFAPIMYRAHYTDSDGQPAGYYVIDYTVTP